MRSITIEELIVVSGGSSMEGSDGMEDLMDGSEDYMYILDNERKTKGGGGGGIAKAPEGGSAQNGNQQVTCPKGTVPSIKQTTQSSNGQGSGSLGVRTPTIGGNMGGQGSASETKTEITITCVKP